MPGLLLACLPAVLTALRVSASRPVAVLHAGIIALALLGLCFAVVWLERLQYLWEYTN